MSKIEFSPNSDFFRSIELPVRHHFFVRNRNFWSKIKIFVKNPNFSQKNTLRFKPHLVAKIRNWILKKHDLWICDPICSARFLRVLLTVEVRKIWLIDQPQKLFLEPKGAMPDVGLQEYSRDFRHGIEILFPIKICQKMLGKKPHIK